MKEATIVLKLAKSVNVISHALSVNVKKHNHHACGLLTPG
ncbi:DUF2607 family protein [Vibrio sp. R-1]|nr:DUF2607 family protein [Vibrio cholerae]MEB3778287.1 DUF2607 family protein [Vibrio sp. R-1]